MLLFTPGPTPVNEDIRNELSSKTIHHRTGEFEAIFKQSKELLKEFLQMDDVILITSSGTGAMESCVINLCKYEALVINSGKFGERFANICKAFNIPFDELKYEWDNPCEVKDIIQAVKNNPKIDAIFLQSCESSGGLRHPIEDVAKEVKKLDKNICIVVDAITSFAVEHIDTTNIDALICGSQKALMLPSGLSFIGLSTLSLNKIGDGVGFYFNLANEIKNQRVGTTSFTPSTIIIQALLKVLLNINSYGIKNLYEDSLKRSISTRLALNAIGLKTYPKTPATAMTCIIDNKAKEIKDMLKGEFNISIASGQGELKNRLFRINHMGFIDVHEACWVVNAIEIALHKMSIRTFTSLASKTFMQNYYELKD